MLKAIFMELNEDLGLMQNIGEKELDTRSPKKAHEKAKFYKEVLSEVRGKNVSYMLSNGCGILATVATK